MNTTMTVPSSQEDRLAFLAFPAKRAAEQVSGTTEGLFQNIAKILNEIVTDALSKRTAAQFCACRDRHIDVYTRVTLGMSKVISATVSEQVIDRLTNESLSEAEADFRDEGVSVLGEHVTTQAMFTVWTLRKINDLAHIISMSADVKPDMVPADADLAEKFVTHIIYGRFHLDCLKHSIRTGTPVFPEVLECISDGLRPMVNAYSYIKQAVDLRSGEQDEPMINLEFDEEEQELLQASMHDLMLEA